MSSSFVSVGLPIVLALTLVVSVVALVGALVYAFVPTVTWPPVGRRQYGREIHKRDHHCHLPVVACRYPDMQAIGSRFSQQGWDVGDQWVCNECLTVWEVKECWPGSTIWEWKTIEQGAGRL